MRRVFLQRATIMGFEIDPNLDTPTGIECPRPDCDKIVVYNGNYFCECGWAAPDWRFTPDEQRYMNRLYEGLKAVRSA